MAKTLTAQGIRHISGLRFLLDGTGAVQGLEVTVEVNYGPFGVAETLEVFPQLSASQRAAAQALYARVKALVEAEYLA